MPRSIRLQELFPDAVADADIIIPGKRKPDPHAEWRLQAKCVKLVRQAMRLRPDLRFIAPQAEMPRTPARAEIAKRMGLQRGVPDLWLLRHQPLRLCVVEFKRPGGKLSPEQQDWFAWLNGSAVKHRCDNADDFAGILAAFLAW